MIEKYALFRIIESLVENKEESTMQDISKNSKTSIGMTKLILDNLEKQDLIRRRRINKKTSLFILSDNFFTREIRILTLLSKIHKSKIVNQLIEEYKDDILSILLFGSGADGSYDKWSDIDILIITRKDIDIKNIKIKTIKEPNILIYSFKKWKNKVKEDPVFYENIIFKNIMLYGENPIVT